MVRPRGAIKSVTLPHNHAQTTWPEIALKANLTRKSKLLLVSNSQFLINYRNENKPKEKIQQFGQAYCKTWPCINLSSKGDNFAFCKLCKTDISFSHGRAI